jgi:1,2-diacylglycerol 3-alpha-glucosyltransferase
MKIAVLFDNLGPYHLARLNAASTRCDLLSIEFATTSGDYAWRNNGLQKNFRTTTIYSEGPSVHCLTRKLRHRLRRALDDFSPDAVAVPGWSGRLAFAAMIWCIQNRVPAVLMSESTADDEPRIAWKEWIKRRYVGMCSAALVGGERNRDYLVQLGMPADKVLLGYDVVDNEYFAQRSAEVRQDASSWRMRLSLPDRYFLASARFIEKKNLPNLLRAYADYRAACFDHSPGGSFPAWDLVVLGDGERRSQLIALQKQLGLSGSVHFPGFRQYDELPSYYACAEAFIHPSIAEPWGLVVNEAMAAPLPVLVSNRCGCASTLVKEGENGSTFEPNDLAAMTHCMLDMTQCSAESRQDMGRRSGEIIAEFGPKRFADGLRQAADIAVANGAKPDSPADLLLLQLLLLKQLKMWRRQCP